MAVRSVVPAAVAFGFRVVLTTGFALMAAILAGIGILGVTARTVPANVGSWGFGWRWGPANNASSGKPYDDICVWPVLES